MTELENVDTLYASNYLQFKKSMNSVKHRKKLSPCKNQKISQISSTGCEKNMLAKNVNFVNNLLKNENPVKGLLTKCEFYLRIAKKLYNSIKESRKKTCSIKGSWKNVNYIKYLLK